MSDRPRKLECEAFLEALEATSPEKGTEAQPGVLLGLMNEPKRGHAEVCADCRAAVEAMSATRRELARLSEAALEPGPWFTTRVMGAIRAKESEIEEKKNGVWVSVRRLAPRLVAFCTLLLVVGGTWAIQLRRSDLAQRQENRPVETVFD